MQALVQAAAAGGCLLVAVLLSKVLPFLVRCVQARRHYLSSPIPGPPVAMGIMGHVRYLMGPKGPFTFLDWANKYGQVYKIVFMDSMAVVLTNADVIARITKKTGPGPYLPKPRALYQALDNGNPPLPNILTSGEDAYWRAVRQATAPCFSMSNMKQVVPMVLDLTQRAADHMAQHDTFDVTDAAKRITSDVMGHLLYGEDLGGVSWEPSEYLEVFYPGLKAGAAKLDNPLHLYRLWDPEVRFQRRCLARTEELMADNVQALRKNPPAPHTIAAHLLSAIDPATGKPLDDRQLRAEMSTFMGAGFETTSHAITWNLTMLASHPEVQDQVLAELQQAGLAAKDGVPGRPFDASDLGRLPLLSAVIKETLRVCAPAPFGGTRWVVQDEGVDMCGFRIPKGTLVMMPGLPHGLSQHNYGADTLGFKPQRWMDTAPAGRDSGSGSINAPPDPNSFQSGPRDCIGQNLARLELQVVLATFLSRFKFSPGPELEQELKLAKALGQSPVSALHALAGAFITLQPMSGHMMLKISSRV